MSEFCVYNTYQEATGVNPFEDEAVFDKLAAIENDAEASVIEMVGERKNTRAFSLLVQRQVQTRIAGILIEGGFVESHSEVAVSSNSIEGEAETGSDESTQLSPFEITPEDVYFDTQRRANRLVVDVTDTSPRYAQRSGATHRVNRFAVTRNPLPLSRALN